MVVPGPYTDAVLKTATYATLATLYGIGTGVSLIQLVRICRSTKERFTSQTILHMFVFLTLCCTEFLWHGFCLTICSPYREQFCPPVHHQLSSLLFFGHVPSRAFIYSFPLCDCFLVRMRCSPVRAFSDRVLLYQGGFVLSFTRSNTAFHHFLVVFTVLFYVAAIIVYALFLTLHDYDQMAILYKVRVHCCLMFFARSVFSCCSRLCLSARCVCRPLSVWELQ